MEKRLAGKVAIVTGAGRGIGRAYAHRLAELGANVVVTDIDLTSFKDFEMERKNLKADSVVEEIEQYGVQALGLKVDVTKMDECDSMAKATIEKFGRIDIVVCNAGGGMGTLTDSFASSLDLDDTQAVIDRNLYGTIHTCKATIPYMKEQNSGKIVTVSSLDGILARVDGSYAHYGMAKSAIVGYTRYLAQELGSYQINVNSIAPGYIETGRLSIQFEKIGREKLEGNVTLGRLGTVEDCANVMEFLTTELSNYVTGQVISVCGGIVKGAY